MTGQAFLFVSEQHTQVVSVLDIKLSLNDALGLIIFELVLRDALTLDINIRRCLFEILLVQTLVLKVLQ